MIKRLKRWFKRRELKDLLRMAVVYKFRALLNGDHATAKRYDQIVRNIRQELRELEA
ncbi:hypothetical protein [Roseibium aggregatum]|uniref:Uncharacterized protein n=1 Tax=Roseibium aggregatum TaxID=187304 RepID=A0A0M6Y6H2_9HYPH|nr:hypothetical protein [Roseibium aggregatum]CTQ45695.1 hypothetical protein LAL4801_04150 [Roseibium aggregatum]